MKFSKKDALVWVTPAFTVLLFALYPLLALYAYNVGELVLTQLSLPIIFTLALSTVLFGLWLIILKNNFKASLATVIFLILFWNYEFIYMGITKIVNLQYWHLIPLLFFIYFHLVYFITKIKQQKTLINLNTILLLPISLLIIINVVTILPSEFRKNKTLNNIKVNQQVQKEITGKSYPDIILLLLDEYASIKTMKEEWGYDNSAFGLFLKEKGFFIAEESKSRFDKTLTAMPSLLNLDYVDKNSTDVELYQKYNNNYLFNFFDKIGYKIFFLDAFSRSQHTLKLNNIIHIYYEDIDIEHGYRLDEFSKLIANQSMLSPFIYLFEGTKTNVFYEVNKYFFNYIYNYPLTTKTIKQPTFLYTHFNCPHLPYVFDRNGNFTENPTNYWEYGSVDKIVLKKLYLEQYIYLTKRISNIVSKILETSKNEPIIIIQSDHGPRSSSVGVESEVQHYRVFNAVYFPDGVYKNLYNSIAPVNTIRVILNKYFGEHYKILEDK
ncbi:MAG: hypothetical protein NTX61_13055 [Bacteroidetes bacterium]|nr:hypothetical protein [Bacteroidota bacterium]